MYRKKEEVRHISWYMLGRFCRFCYDPVLGNPMCVIIFMQYDYYSVKFSTLELSAVFVFVPYTIGILLFSNHFKKGKLYRQKKS
jgi:hypothetical protein